MKKFLLSWATVILFTPLVVASTKPNHHLVVLADYQNLSNNFGELLNEMEAFGGVSKAERSEIEGFLKTKAISLDTPITKAATNGNTLIYGSQRLTLLPDGSFKTKNGKIVKGAKDEGRDTTFKTTFSALVEKEYSLKFPLQLLIEKAEAGQFADYVDAATAAIGRTLYTGFSMIGVPSCGLLAVPLDGILWWYKKLIIEGTVACIDGRYKMTHYDEFWKQFKTDFNDALRRMDG
jgi:hypothetical protein